MSVQARLYDDVNWRLGLPMLSTQEVNTTPRLAFLADMLREPLRGTEIPFAWRILMPLDWSPPWYFRTGRQIARYLYLDQFPLPSQEEIDQLVHLCEQKIVNNNLPHETIRERWKVLMEEAKALWSPESYRLLQLYRTKHIALN